ncbi:hypothetical protein IAE22_29780, partial [Bacillus sp. S34]|nr:hypothetical protein [Bacillus sp. S34]
MPLDEDTTVLASGVAEIGLNVEAAAVERQLSRPVVPVLHACFSLGTVIGGAAGIVLTIVLALVIDLLLAERTANRSARHTVVVGGEKYALHLLPSGLRTPG